MDQKILKWIKIVVLRTLKEKNLIRLDVNVLISAGMLGYVQALKRFDPKRGVKFKTFAEYRIKGAVLDEVRKMIGDERCKNKRPSRVDEYDYTLISDSGHSQVEMEGNIDLENFFNHVPLNEREVEILKCRAIGMSLHEIADRFSFSDSRASQILVKIKKEVYYWYRDELGINFELSAARCPACGNDNVVAAKIEAFRCDFCDVQLILDGGIPILVADDQVLEDEDEE